MRLPIKRKNGASVLSLPNLSGGLNLRDGISEILDNQMTDCENMWWQDGILKTRPGIETNIENFFNIRYDESQDVRIRAYPNIKHIDKYGEIFYLQVVEIVFGSQKVLRFYWVNSEHTVDFSKGGIYATNYFVCMHKNMLYCFTSDQKIYKFDVNAEEEESKWLEAENDIYVPKVLIQCKKIKGVNATKDQVMSSGVMIEGFNILSDYYKMSFNSYNPEIVTVDNPSHEMRYHIIESVANAKYENKTVTAVYTKDGVEYTHTVTLNGRALASEETSVNEKDNLRMKVWRNTVSFWDKDDKIATVSDGGEDDLVITAPYISSNTDKAKVFGMTQSVWFGGGSAGLQGGTRLFLCGNSSEPALVLWSDLNNPLFFPENSYFYVGDSSSRVTGFGKQSDMLVIFKKNETWCTTYHQNTDITAESLINQSVIDFTASSVYFPLVQINPNIGCPYPDTVQLCRNRLVWLGEDNKVYTLVSESAYNERSIFCVSEMIERKLMSHASIVTSCDWNGYYCLYFGGKMLLMDYNCYGFTHIASHSKTEDANIKIPWFYWTFPIDGIMSTINGNIVFSHYYKGSIYQNFGIGNSVLFERSDSVDKVLREKDDSEGLETVEAPIFSTMNTKVFDFGVPHVRKNIEQVNLQLGNNDGKEIKVHFITENGSEETEVYLDGTETESYTAGYIDSRAVFPCIKQVLRFGLKIESRGKLAVDSVIIKYRNTGGAR